MYRTRCLTIVAVTLGVLSKGGSTWAEDAGAKGRVRQEEMVLRTYDVRELCGVIMDCPGPEVGLPESLQGSYWSPDPRYRGSPSWGAASLAEMLKLRVSPESWGPGIAAVQESDGLLAVLQTPAAHAQITALLDNLRDDTCHQVLVQGLVLAVDGRTAAGLRASKSREFTPGEAEGLVKAAGRDGVLFSAQVVCANKQRNHVANLKSIRSIQHYNGIAPIAADVNIGMLFDVRPILNADRSIADVEMRLTMAGDWQERQAEFSTLFVPVGDQPDQPAPEQGRVVQQVMAAQVPQVFRGKISLPRLSAWRLRNSVAVPLNKYVLAAMGPAAPWEAKGKKFVPTRTVVVLIRATVLSGRRGLPPLREPGPLGLVERAYDIADLNSTLQEFHGPILGLSSEEAPHAQPVFSPPLPDPAALRPGMMSRMIKMAIEPQSWGINGTAIEERDGKLCVFHTPAVHQQVAQMIAAQRAECKPQLSIQTVAVVLDEAVAAELRLRASSEFSPQEVEGLVKKDCTAELLAEPQILSFNTQGVCVSGTRAVRCVKGFGTQGSTLAPVPGIARTGWALDVRPVLNLDRRAANVDLRFSWCDQWEERAEEPATILFTAGGKTLPVKLPWQVPSVKCWTVQGSPRVPLGKYVLAGSFQRQAADSGSRKRSAPRTVVVLVKADTPAESK